MGDEAGFLWAVGLVSAAIFGWLAKITHMLTNLSEKYVPRSQIDARFLAEKQDRKEDMTEIRGQLERILNKLDGKADK